MPSFRVPDNLARSALAERKTGLQATVTRRSLTDWLDHIQRQHPAGIALGLDRVRAVANRLGLSRPARCVLTVAGTNGKGSTVAFVEAIARAAGLRVGAYTSPHLLRYNERVRIDGADASDAGLVAGFEAVEAARGELALTYFEFGTLAALWQFERADLDLAVLEVGLGGRLDAVNLIDADVMIITSVALDHQDWLGTDRESIGVEKAGVMRAGRPVVLAERDPPASVLRHAYALGALTIRAGCDYFVEREADHWRWREPGYAVRLPYPQLLAPAQLDNAGAAIAALRASPLRLPRRAFRAGIAAARLSGRLQRIPVPVQGGQAELVLDVGHNPQAAGQLALWLTAHPAGGRELALFSALADKDIPALIAPLAGRFAHCWLAGLASVSPRGLEVDALASRVAGVGPVTRCVDVDAALTDALETLRPGDRLLVFGSFFTVAGALAFMERRRQPL
jgi:dihydrofolate synthase/folylpolyglutamate synthase